MEITTHSDTIDRARSVLSEWERACRAANRAKLQSRDYLRTWACGQSERDVVIFSLEMIEKGENGSGRLSVLDQACRALAASSDFLLSLIPTPR